MTDDESVPTIQCSRCYKWHHQYCIGIETTTRSFRCPDCSSRASTPQNNSLSGYPGSDRASSSGFNASELGQSSQPEQVGDVIPAWSSSLNWSEQGMSCKQEVCTYVLDLDDGSQVSVRVRKTTRTIPATFG